MTGREEDRNAIPLTHQHTTLHLNTREELKQNEFLDNLENRFD